MSELDTSEASLSESPAVTADASGPVSDGLNNNAQSAGSNQSNDAEMTTGPELIEETSNDTDAELVIDNKQTEHSQQSENTEASSKAQQEEDVSSSQGASDSATQNESDIPSSLSTDSPVTDTDRSSAQFLPPSVDQPGAEGVAAAQSDAQPSVYHVKWINFKESNYPVITQNENGPCPLLAILNLLILQGKVKLPPMIEIVTSGQLMEYLGDCVFENAPKDISEDALLNYEQNMSDAMAVFHKLQTGLDVNVKFTGVADFEYTPECIVFDLLSIRLYHGWLIDPADMNVVAAVTSCSYNQLVEKIITQKQSSDHDLVTEALVAEEFLNRSASQLTYHGLSELSSTLNEEEMCVFFRNNHFSTLYKHKGELFLLVTDQGFLTESNVVWETLSNVEGDGHFVDAQFRTYRKAETAVVNDPSPPAAAGTSQQVDQDYLVALSLQQEQQQFEEEPSPAAVPSAGKSPPQLSDHELALRLQQEEDRSVARQRQQAANQRHLEQQYAQHMAEQRERKKEKSDCIIL